VGAGAEIAAGADLRVGGHNLKLAWAGARLGVPVGPARLTPLIGLSRAKDLVYTGRVVGAAEAAALGLLHRVVPAAEAEPAALELAGAIAAQSGTGVRVLKQMFRNLEHSAERVAYENELLMRFQQDGSGLPRATG
jgi:enoyl-CoA hydratase/carnithine racemase